jgi:hypothetical protein
MLRHAVEHHLVICYGDCTEDLAQFSSFAGIERIVPSGSACDGLLSLCAGEKEPLP